MDYIGWGLGVVSIGYAVFTNIQSKQERRRIHSFLKGLKPGIAAGNYKDVLRAVNDEMATLIPAERSGK